MKFQLQNHDLIFTMENSDSEKKILDLFERFRVSRKNRYLYVQNRNVFLNGNPVKSGEEKIKTGDVIVIHTEEEPIDFPLAEKPCTVVYEDELIYVVHKDAGIIIHSDDGSECLASQAARWQADHNLITPVRYIHRLDKDTSGLVLFVKVPFFQAWYDEQLSEKHIQRIYSAIVKGDLEVGAKRTFNDRLGKDRHIAGKYRVSSTGKDAKTHVTCLKASGPYRLLKCELDTGRTHQIRVHLSAHALPIINDNLYGVTARAFKGMGLWASELHVPSPIDGHMTVIKDSPNSDYLYFED